MKLIVKRESSELSALRKASNYLSIGRTLSLLSRSIFIENSRGAIHNNHREKDADTGTLSIVFFFSSFVGLWQFLRNLS